MSQDWKAHRAQGAAALSALHSLLADIAAAPEALGSDRLWQRIRSQVGLLTHTIDSLTYVSQAAKEQHNSSTHEVATWRRTSQCTAYLIMRRIAVPVQADSEAFNRYVAARGQQAPKRGPTLPEQIDEALQRLHASARSCEVLLTRLQTTASEVEQVSLPL